MLGPKGQSGLRLPLSALRPRLSSRLRPENPTAWGRPSVDGPSGDAGRGEQRAGPTREEGVCRKAPWEPPRAPSRQRWGAAVVARILSPLPAPPAPARRAEPSPAAAVPIRAWERSPARLTNRKGLKPGAEGGARLRLRQQASDLSQSEHSLPPPASPRVSGRAQAHLPISGPLTSVPGC